MIITNCTNCNEVYFYPYEAGEEPCGEGVYGKWVCPICEEINYTERTMSDFGQTINEKIFRHKQMEEVWRRV